LATKHLTAAEVLNFRDQAFGTYFNHPTYLQKVKRLFGQEAVSHIMHMASHKLERRHAG